ncbi:Vacuolar protein sorting-associated protein 54, partial [Nowakowskiella sp. JEL0078]
MSFDSFFKLMLFVYTSVLHIIQRVALFNELQLSILKEAQENGIIIGSRLESQIPSSQQLSGGQDSPNKLKRRSFEEEEDLGSLDMLNVPVDETFKSSLSVANFSTSLQNSVFNADTRSTYPQLIQESSDILHASSDVSHVRCAKLLGVRSEQNSQLNTKDFFRLFGATWEFVIAGESLCGRLSFGLKGTMISQAKSFLSYFHDEKTKQIALLIENEQWAQIEVPVDFQNLAEQIIHQTVILNSMSKSENGSINILSNSSSYSSISDHDPGSSRSSLAEEDVLGGRVERPQAKVLEQTGKSLKYLTLGKERYYVVNCVIMFLKMLTEYMQCVENIPSVTTDVLNRISEIIK